MAAIFQTPKTKRDSQTGKKMPVLDASGNPILLPKWRAIIITHRGIRKTFTFTKNRAQSQKQADLLEAREKEIRLGLRPVPTMSEAAARRPIDDIFGEYLAWGDTQGGRGGRPWSPQNSKKRRYYLAWWKDRLKLKTLSDLYDRLPDAEKAIRSLTGGKSTRAGKTLAAYKEGLNVFCHWCEERKYISENPFDGMGNFDISPKTPRRAMTLEEILTLLETCPPHRRLLYETAFASGFRAGELRCLTLDHIDREACGLRLSAEEDKGRKSRFQPITRDLLDRLVAFGESGEAKQRYAAMRRKAGLDDDDKIPTNPLLYIPSQPARAIQDDLTKAGIPVTTKEGKLDFHACRTAYVNLVIAAGADVKTAQELARHSTPHLTMNIYGRVADFRLTRVAEAVGQMIAQPAEHNTDEPAGNEKKLHSPDISTQNSDLSKEETPCIARGSNENNWYRRVELKETYWKITTCQIQTNPRQSSDRIPHIPVTGKGLHPPRPWRLGQIAPHARQMGTKSGAQKTPKHCPNIAQVKMRIRMIAYQYISTN